MNTVLLLLGVVAAAPIDVSVTPIRGSEVAGRLLDVTSQQIIIHTPDGDVTFKSEEILRATPARELTAPPAGEGAGGEEAAIVATLVDGSVAPATQYTVDSGRATVVLLDGTEMTVPTRAIDHVRFMPRTAATFDQWQELLANPRKSDAVVIRKTAAAADGEDQAVDRVALDAPEGVLGNIDASSVGFEFDDSTVNVPRAKVAGVIYFHRTTLTPRDPICRVIDAAGSSWNARSLELKEEVLNGICVSGVRFAIPLEQLAALDYSVGNVDYLSDLPRESVVWKPRRIAGNPPSAHQWFSPKFDTGLYGSVLKLDDEPYEKGLALHSHAEVTYRLTKRYRNLLARVGVDDGFRYEADLELQIYGDNDLIFSRKIKGPDKPFDLDLDMQGIRRLKIVVTFGDDDSDRGDNLNLCNARLTK